MDYKTAGVDIEAGYESVELMKKYVKETMRPEVLGGLGGFSGAFSLKNIKDMEDPVLLSGTDGCGQSGSNIFYMVNIVGGNGCHNFIVGVRIRSSNSDRSCSR